MTGIEERLSRNGVRRPGSSAAKRVLVQTWAQFSLIAIGLIWASSFVFGFNTALGLLTMMGFLGALIGLGIPEIGLLGVGMLAALDEVNRRFLFEGGGGILRWNTFNYWLLLVAILSIPLLLRLRDPHTRILQVFILLAGLQLVISPDKSSGLQVIISVLSVFGIMVYFARVSQETSTLKWLGMVNGTLGALGGLAFNLQFESLPYLDPNVWSFFPATCLISVCIAYSALGDRRQGKIGLLFLAVMNAVWIFLSGSRGNMLIGLSCFVYLFLATQAFSWKVVGVVVTILGGIWLSVQFSARLDHALERLDTTLNPSYSLTRRTSRRSDIAQAGWQLFLENPLGVGTGGFRARSGRTEFLESGRPAHSAWVKTLAENGILGIGLMGAYVASFVFAGWKGRRGDLFLTGFFVSATLALIFISKEFEGVGMWFLAAWGTVVLHHGRPNNQIGASVPRINLREYRYGPK